MVITRNYEIVRGVKGGLLHTVTIGYMGRGTPSRWQGI